MAPSSAFSSPTDARIPLLAKEEPMENHPNILAEITLSRDHRAQEQTIKKELEILSIKRVRLQFVRLGNPPQNIGIGGNVPAEVARRVMRLAIEYNQGIQYLLPESRFVPDYVAIGTSAFDEASQVPVSPEAIDRLMDSSLTNPQFHSLYRSLTRDNNY